MADEADKILLAQIGAPHGVRGEVRVKSFTADPLALRDYKPLVSRDGRLFVVERLRPAKDVLVVKFRGLDDRNAAEALNGTRIFVSREALPEPDEDEFYHADLIGLAAMLESGEPFGTIVAFHDHGAGEMVEVAPPQGQTLLVPFTQAAVPVIDIAAGRVVVVPPPEISERDEDSEGGEGKPADEAES
ncbi:16S rRNA processing protein RimM [Faunimonas pinastri]|uniref:Ribosome maturation factor RimM n=1 Tax=Faunimonas pinastri TaxID=1855383 RepID=A0A1H9MDC6_9HYPH|nr:ribosome maturation factor RimM [Faunimonas pinastri]SER21499.1 16S rRNA processing protein RimM [Faunimonas pinastri]